MSTRTLTKTRNALKQVKSKNLRTDLEKLIAGVEKSMNADDKELLQIRVNALASMACLKETLGAVAGGNLLRGIFEDVDRHKLNVKIVMWQRFHDRACSKRDKKKMSFCTVPKEGWECIDNGMGTCFSWGP